MMKSTLMGVATAVLRVVPPAAASPLARAVGTACWFALPARRRTLLANLAHLVPDATAARRRALARATFRNLALCTLDLLRGPHLSPADVRQMVEVEGQEHLDAALARGRGVLLVSPHLGAFEMGGRCLTAHGYEVAGYAEQAEDARLKAVYERYRTVAGVTVLPLGGNARAGVAWLKRGGALVLFADRAIGTRAHEVRFGGGIRPLPAGVAALARHTGAAVLYSVIVRQAGSRRPLRWIVEPPATDDFGRMDEAAGTQVVADRLASLVARYPDQWFVFQPEWRTSPRAPVT